MSAEKVKNKIKNEVDEYLKSKSDTAVSKEEMVEGISDILQEYVEVPKFEAVSAELLRDGKYPAIRYTIRRK